MANGTFSKTKLASSPTPTDLHGVPSNVEFQTITISVFNNSPNETTVSLYIATSTPGIADKCAMPTIAPYGTYDYACRPLGPGEHVYASCTDSGDNNIHVFGLTKGA